MLLFGGVAVARAVFAQVPSPSPPQKSDFFINEIVGLAAPDLTECVNALGKEGCVKFGSGVSEGTIYIEFTMPRTWHRAGWSDTWGSCTEEDQVALATSRDSGAYGDVVSPASSNKCKLPYIVELYNGTSGKFVKMMADAMNLQRNYVDHGSAGEHLKDWGAPGVFFRYLGPNADTFSANEVDSRCFLDERGSNDCDFFADGMMYCPACQLRHWGIALSERVEVEVSGWKSTFITRPIEFFSFGGPAITAKDGFAAGFTSTPLPVPVKRNYTKERPVDTRLDPDTCRSCMPCQEFMADKLEGLVEIDTCQNSDTFYICEQQCTNAGCDGLDRDNSVCTGEQVTRGGWADLGSFQRTGTGCYNTDFKSWTYARNSLDDFPTRAYNSNGNPDGDYLFDNDTRTNIGQTFNCDVRALSESMTTHFKSESTITVTDEYKDALANTVVELLNSNTRARGSEVNRDQVSVEVDGTEHSITIIGLPPNQYIQDLMTIAGNGLSGTYGGTALTANWANSRFEVYDESSGGGGSNGDPHLHFAHGGRADYRGENRVIVSFFSAPGIALNVKTEDATFTPPWWPGTTVDGSYITEAPPPPSPTLLPLPLLTVTPAHRRMSSHAWAAPRGSGQTPPSSLRGSPSSTPAPISSPAPAAATPSRLGSARSCGAARRCPSSRTTRAPSLRRPLSPCSQ